MSKTLICAEDLLNALKDSLAPAKDEVDVLTNAGKVEAMCLVKLLAEAGKITKHFYRLLDNRIKKLTVVYAQYHEELEKTSFICKYDGDDDTLYRFWDFEIGTNIFYRHKDAVAFLDNPNYDGETAWQVRAAGIPDYRFVVCPVSSGEWKRSDIGISVFTSEEKAEQIATVKNLRLEVK